MMATPDMDRTASDISKQIQMISGELHLETLAGKIVLLLEQITGARQVNLIFAASDGPRLAARSSGGEAVLENQPLTEHPEISRDIVRESLAGESEIVRREGQSAVLSLALPETGGCLYSDHTGT